MAFEETIASYFTDFAETAIWSVGAAEVLVIFDNAYVDPMGVFEGTFPAATVMTADLPTLAHGQTLTIGGTVYTVVEVQPDTTGLTAVCRLRT